MLIPTTTLPVRALAPVAHGLAVFLRALAALIVVPLMLVMGWCSAGRWHQPDRLPLLATLGILCPDPDTTVTAITRALPVWACLDALPRQATSASTERR